MVSAREVAEVHCLILSLVSFLFSLNVFNLIYPSCFVLSKDSQYRGSSAILGVPACPCIMSVVWGWCGATDENFS